MKKSFKSEIAKATSQNIELNKKVLQMKTSWDEVEGLLKSTTKPKKRKP